MPSNPLYGTSDDDRLQIGDGSGTDTIFGDDRNDFIIGLAGDDSLVGEGGNDSVYGGEGNDRVDGLDGSDFLFGGDGEDYFDAGWGNDRVYGGNGNDTISAGFGSDRLNGGAGDDSIVMSDLIPFGTDLAYGNQGDDTATFVNWASGFFDGGDGHDTLTLLWSMVGNDHHRRSHVDFGGPNPVAVSMSDKGAADVKVTFANVEALSIQTGFANDTIIGGSGDDRISVHLGDNVVDGGGGDDTVSYLVSGRNMLEGGSGTDTVVVIGLNYLVLEFDASGTTGSDGHGSVLSGFETFVVNGGGYGDAVTLASGADQFNGSFGADTAHGGGGRDTLFGARAGDVLHGDDGDDRLRGGRGQDTLYGGADRDLLFGGLDADVLFGGGGNDTLIGGSGADLFWGDAGADTFRFTTPSEGAEAEDVIADFATGIDRVMIGHDLLAGSPTMGRQSAAVLSFGAFNGTEAQFIYIISGSTGLLFWDSDGAGLGESTLITTFWNAPTLAGTDIHIV